MNESMSLAGINPVQGGAVYVTQYVSSSGAFSGRPSYAISNDLVSKNVCTRDSNGTLSVVLFDDLFKNKNMKIFKYTGNKSSHDIFKEVFANLNKEIDDNFIYETVSGKKLLSDDQLECDEQFEEIDPYIIQAETASIIKTIKDEYKETKGILNDIPIMSKSDIEESKRLTNNSNISFYETENGYFAENVITRKRTGIYKSISEIPVKIIE